MSPGIGIVISTLGRVADLTGIAADLAQQTILPACVVVVNQSGRSVEESLKPLAGRVPLKILTSDRGLSKGRNVGAGEIAHDVDYLFFPNDTSRLGPDFLAEVSSRLAGSVVSAVTCVDEHGPRYRMPAGDILLDERNVWRILEPGLIVQSRLFLAHAGFDERLGSGADSPWQSGEGTDFLLRLARNGTVCRFMPDVNVTVRAEAAGLDIWERRRKLRAYGRGSGYVLRKWKYSPLFGLRSVVGAALLGIRYRGKYTLTDGLWASLGRLEGYLHVCIGTDRIYAVTR